MFEKDVGLVRAFALTAARSDFLTFLQFYCNGSISFGK
jgi:hypothetical protein